MKKFKDKDDTVAYVLNLSRLYKGKLKQLAQGRPPNVFLEAVIDCLLQKSEILKSIMRSVERSQR